MAEKVRQLGGDVARVESGPPQFLKHLARVSRFLAASALAVSSGRLSTAQQYIGLPRTSIVNAVSPQPCTARHVVGMFLPNALLKALKTMQGLKGPQLLHVITTKGKGFELAEGDQIDLIAAGAYEAVGHFDLFAAQAMLYFATVSFAVM